MRIGLIVGLHGTADEHPGWDDILAQARAAEDAGFDLVIVEDALLLAGDSATGFWESVSMVAALAATTERIGIGHGVLNAPYRSPAMTAAIAETLDEISGGRYVLGIGMGNTPDDYGPFGIDADRRYSRFAEALPIITDLLRTGRAARAGRFHRADGAELVLRGPRAGGPPVVVAARGPRMLRLTAQLADGWNWWTAEGVSGLGELADVVRDLEEACAEEGRDPATLTRTLDVYSVAVPADGVSRASADEIAQALLRFGELGFEEIRIGLAVPGAADARPDAIASMREVVRLVHAGE